MRSTTVTVFWLSFVLVFLKKWEPGAPLDSLSYAAVAKNLMHAPHWYYFRVAGALPPIQDHMPFTYWITAGMFHWLGPTDFVSRIYPCLMSFLSYILVYLLGTQIKDRFYGLLGVLLWALCFEASKWNGALLQDIPLTTYALGLTYCFLRGRSNPVWFYGCGACLFLGFFTKGPLIFGVPLGILLGSLVGAEFGYLKSRHFWISLAATVGVGALLMAVQRLPDGSNYFVLFFRSKMAYLPWQGGVSGYFAYLPLILKFSPLTALALLFSMPGYIRKEWPKDAVLMLGISLGFLLPLSMAWVKFPHYLIPFYPFFSLAAVPWVHERFHSQQMGMEKGLRWLAIAIVLLAVALPVKITGKREKTALNLVYLLNQDNRISQKKVYLLGSPITFRTVIPYFKFYGDMDLICVASAAGVNLEEDYLLVPLESLPLRQGERSFGLEDCRMRNGRFCVLGGGSIQFQPDDRRFIEEIYPDRFSQGS